MKYDYLIFHSEHEALNLLGGKNNLTLEEIAKPYHHKKRVKLYPGLGIVKKYRPNRPNLAIKSYGEACAHMDLDNMGVNVPKVKGIIHSADECSILFEYIDSNPLISSLILNKSDVQDYIFKTGLFMGIMFENRFLHGDLTAYHIFAERKVYFFDLELTRAYNNEEFYLRLPREWRGFVDSKQGRRWNVPLSRNQEEILFEGVTHNLSKGRAFDILEKKVLSRT